MIKSMTGYGKGQAEQEGLSLSVEIKSVNHRYGDVTIKAPRSMMSLEMEIKKSVSEKLKRGKIDVFITQEINGGGVMAPALNRPLAAAYVALFEDLRTEFPVDGGIPLSLLVSQKEVVTLREGDLPPESLKACLDSALATALQALEAMRTKEGEATLRDMEARLEVVEKLLAAVEKRAPQVAAEWQTKLKERLGRLAGDLAVDEQRIAQEIAIFADRCDISEELVRFRSHLSQFRSLFGSDEPVGRQMDFLVQELNREVNTMGSKSNDAELTRQVVAIKAELEKVREQVQNVE